MSLIAIVVQYRATLGSMMVRRELDDIRVCFAESFATVFPENFSREEIIVPHQLTGETVVWQMFLNQLSEFVDIFLEANVDEATRRVTFKQKAGVWRYCDPKVFSAAAPDTLQVPIFEQDRMADVKLRSQYKRAYDKWSQLSLVTEEILFFIPVFIWAYSVLKKLAIQDDKAVEKYRRRISVAEAYIAKAKKGTEVPLDLAFDSAAVARAEDESLEDWTLIGESFDTGTGESVRSSSGWRQAVQKMGTAVKKRTPYSIGEMRDAVKISNSQVKKRKRNTRGDYTGVDTTPYYQRAKPFGTIFFLRSEPSLMCSLESPPSPTDSTYMKDGAVLLGAVTNELRLYQSLLKFALSERKRHRDSLFYISMLLQVLFRPTVVAFILHYEYRLHETTNYIGHRPFLYNSTNIEKLNNIALIFKKGPAEHRQHLVKFPASAHQKNVNDIAQLFKRTPRQDEGDFDRRGDPSLEADIDGAILQTITDKGIPSPFFREPADMRNLLVWFDDLRPVAAV